MQKTIRIHNALTALLATFLLTQLVSTGYSQRAGSKDKGQILHWADRISPAASLVAIEDGLWQFQIQGKQDNERLSLEQIVRWGCSRGVLGRQAIWLSDGSWLAGEIQLDSQDRVQLQSKWLQLGPVPIKSIRALLLSPVSSLADWTLVQQAVQNFTGDSDSIWLRDRKQITGLVHLESLTTNSTAIEVTSANQRMKIPLEQISIVAFSPALHGPLPNDPMQLGLDDGSLLNSSLIKSIENRTEIVCLSGLKAQSLDFPDDFLSSIVYLSHPVQDNVVRLDQLKPASYKHIADSSLDFSLGINKDVYGQPLVTGSRRQAGYVFHGLAMHSSSQVAFRWDGSPGKLLAETQLAANSPATAEAVCKVLLARDGQLATVAEFTLNKQLTADPRQLLEVDVSKSQLVVLVVEKGTQSQFGDHVLWLDARIVKQ